MHEPIRFYAPARPKPQPRSPSRTPAWRVSRAIWLLRSLGGALLASVLGICLLLLAGCGAMPSSPPAVADRPTFAPPRLSPPMLPEALPEPVQRQRTIWRHLHETPSPSSA